MRALFWRMKVKYDVRGQIFFRTYLVGPTFIFLVRPFSNSLFWTKCKFFSLRSTNLGFLTSPFSLHLYCVSWTMFTLRDVLLLRMHWKFWTFFYYRWKRLCISPNVVPASKYLSTSEKISAREFIYSAFIRFSAVTNYYMKTMGNHVVNHFY